MPSLEKISLLRGGMSRRLLLSAALVASFGLAWPVKAGERIVVGQTFLAPGLDPAKGSAGWALVSHGLAENLFTVGRDGRVMPLLADNAVRTGDTSWEITLKPGRHFSDGSDVTADKVAQALNRTGAENPQARASVGRITFEAQGPLTLRAISEKASPVLPAVLAEWTFPVYAMTEAGPLFTGPWKVVSFEPDKQIVMAANPSYLEANARPDVLLRKFSDAQSLALAVQSGEVDLGFNLPSEALQQLTRSPGVTVKSFAVGYQYMMWMNTTRPALADVRVRRALDLAIDRNLLALAVNGGKPATGAFSLDYPFASPTPRPFDVQQASVLLDEAGWKRDGAMRKKDGQTLTLDILAYPQRPDLVTFLPVLKSELAKLGIETRTRIADNIAGPLKEGAFDLALWAQHTAPAGDPAFFLNISLRSGGPNNFARYSSVKLDAVLDRFTTATDPAERATLAREAEMIVFADAPVSYLLTPVWHVGLSKKLAGYEPWGSDYYVLRPDVKVMP